MYEACVAQVLSEYKSMHKDAILRLQLEEMSQYCSHVKPEAVQTLLNAPTHVYLEEEARVKFQIAVEGDSHV